MSTGITSVNHKEHSLRVVWVGFHAEGLYAFSNLLAEGVSVNALLTLNEVQKQKRSGTTNMYKVICDRYGIPYYPINHINDTGSYQLLSDLKPDLICVIGWSQIVDPRVIRLARIGAIGAHASLLPHNRGSAPVNWALINGEDITGNSLIWLDEGVDTGHIIEQTPIPISLFDTCATIYNEVARSNYYMIRRLLDALRQGHKPGVPQLHIGQPLLPRRRLSDGQINWIQSARRVYDFVRALMRPYPGAFSFLDGEKVFVWSCSLLPSYPTVVPGYIVGPVVSPVDDACGVLVGCDNGAIVLHEIELSDGTILKGRSLAEQRWKGKVWSNG